MKTAVHGVTSHKNLKRNISETLFQSELHINTFIYSRKVSLLNIVHIYSKFTLDFCLMQLLTRIYFFFIFGVFLKKFSGGLLL